MKSQYIVFTGGGTGGHVYPALPIIEELKKEGYEALWIGSKKGMERGIVESWSIPYKSVATGKLRRYFSLQNFTDIFRILLGFFQSYFFLLKVKPKALFSKGGFVSVPPVIAASLLGIPVYTHDSDVDPGLATKINSRFVRKVFVAYEDCLKYYSIKLRDRVLVSGNPVRSTFFQNQAPLSDEMLSRLGDKPLVMVIGGSLGAQQINGFIEKIAPRLSDTCQIIHQTGSKNELVSNDPNWLTLPYITDDLPGLLQRADLVISRAGAGSLWEFAASALPSILLPLKVGSRGDQLRNAEIFKKLGMAKVIDEPSEDILYQAILDLLGNSDELASMRKAGANFITKPAEQIICEEILRELG